MRRIITRNLTNVFWPPINDTCRGAPALRNERHTDSNTARNATGSTHVTRASGASMTQTISTTRQPGRAATAAFIGTMIEWYDFYIYATAAALVFGELSFPSQHPFVRTME